VHRARTKRKKKPRFNGERHFFSLHSGSGDNVVIRERDRKRISVSTMGRRSHCVREIRSAECERIGSPGCDLRIESFQNRLLFLLFFLASSQRGPLDNDSDRVHEKKYMCAQLLHTHTHAREMSHSHRPRHRLSLETFQFG